MNLYKLLILLFSIPLLISCNIKHEKKPLPLNQATVIEVVIYQTKPGVKDAEHLKNAASITPILANFNGFIARQFSKTTDGKWIDLVYWKDLSSAEKAAETIAHIPACQTFLADIDSQKMEFMHSTILNKHQ
jgi:hypothetical protein